jgi:hypothetical protein
MCGKATVVRKGARPICDACRDEEKNLYVRVRSLLRQYHGTPLTIQDVADMLKVDEKKITHLVDSGYFQLVMANLRMFDE